MQSTLLVRLPFTKVLFESNEYFQGLHKAQAEELLPEGQTIHIDVLAYLFGETEMKIDRKKIAEYYAQAAKFDVKVTQVEEEIKQFCREIVSAGYYQQELHSLRVWEQMDKIHNINPRALSMTVSEMITKQVNRSKCKIVEQLVQKWTTSRLASRLLLDEGLLNSLYNQLEQTLSNDSLNNVNEDFWIIDCFCKPVTCPTATLLHHPDKDYVANITEFVQNLHQLCPYLPLPPSAAAINNKNNNNNESPVMQSSFSLDEELNNFAVLSAVLEECNNGSATELITLWSEANAALWKNAVIAGGAVVAALQSSKKSSSLYYSCSDIDIFLYGEIREQETCCHRWLKHFTEQAAIHNKKLYIGRHQHIVNVFFTDYAHSIQLIFSKPNTTKTRVIFDFDLTFCQVLFDGKQVCAPYQAITSLNSRTTSLRTEISASLQRELNEKDYSRLVPRLHKAEAKGYQVVECPTLVQAAWYNYLCGLIADNAETPTVSDSDKSATTAITDITTIPSSQTTNTTVTPSNNDTVIMDIGTEPTLEQIRELSKKVPYRASNYYYVPKFSNPKITVFFFLSSLYQLSEMLCATQPSDLEDCYYEYPSEAMDATPLLQSVNSKRQRDRTISQNKTSISDILSAEGRRKRQRLVNSV
jgi:hypothetical protein